MFSTWPLWSLIICRTERQAHMENLNLKRWPYCTDTMYNGSKTLLKLHCKSKYRGSPTYSVFTTTDPTTAIFGLGDFRISRGPPTVPLTQHLTCKSHYPRKAGTLYRSKEGSSVLGQGITRGPTLVQFSGPGKNCSKICTSEYVLHSQFPLVRIF